MSESPAACLRKLPVPDDFRAGLRDIHGSFSFEADDMMQLGEVYFELYPEAAGHRDNDQVLAGYEIVRVSIFEKLVEDVPPEEKDILWGMLKNSSDVPRYVNELFRNRDYTLLVELRDSLTKKLKHIQRTIDKLPHGEIRERFMGGVAVFPNTLYLFNLALEKISREKHGA